MWLEVKAIGQVLAPNQKSWIDGEFTYPTELDIDGYTLCSKILSSTNPLETYYATLIENYDLEKFKFIIINYEYLKAWIKEYTDYGFEIKWVGVV